MKLFNIKGVVLVGLTYLATASPVLDGQGLPAADTGTDPTSGLQSLHTLEMSEMCTPNLKMCAADGVTLLVCNKYKQWEEFKKCAACCRYGTHGYPDCYTQCDPTRPPVTRSTFNAPGDPGPAISPSNTEYTCTLGQRQCSPDGKTLQHCLSNGEWVDLHACPTGCLETPEKSASCAKYAFPDIKPRQAHSYGLCSSEEEGKKKCGSQWWIVLCKNGQWVNWELCSKGAQCENQSDNEPKCGVLDLPSENMKPENHRCKTPGRQTCHNEGRTLVICNMSHEWKKVGDCLGGRNCCRADKSAGTAFCAC